MKRWSSSSRSSWVSIIVCYWGLVGLVVVTESFIIPTTTSTPLRRLAQPIPYIQYPQHCRVLSNHYSVGYGGITVLSNQQQNTIEEKEKSATTKTRRKNRSWEESFQLLVSYNERHGNCNVPQRYKEDRRLGRWVASQRSRKDKLNDERIEKLDGLGFSWSNEIFEEQWEEMFQKLVIYAKENDGDCNIPRKEADNDDNKKLRKWVEEQRKRKSLLSKERYTKLENLGLIWEDSKKVKADQKWNGMYERIQKYKRKYGNCRVPQRWEEDRALGLWVYTQRQNYKMGQLREDRQIKLDQIDFTWKVRDAVGGPNYVELDFQWLVMYLRLLNFLEEHGHCNIPIYYKKDISLGLWVSRQRQNQKNRTLRQDRKERLDDIGFTWNFDDQKDEQWNEKYKELKRFKEKYGHVRLPETSRSRIDWVSRQRVQFAAGRLKLERKTLLDEIDFRWEIQNSSA